MRLIDADDVLSIVDDLRNRMTVEGYCAMVERIKALPSAQPVDKDIDVTSNDCISRQMLLEYIHGEPVGKLLCDKYNLDGLIEQFPSAQPNLQPTCNQLATDCISRQAAIDALRMDIDIIPYAKAREYARAVIETVYNRLEDLPSAQPERKTGRWIYDEERCATGIYAICSACNESIYQTGNFRYCPNCGARMEGTE